MNEKQATAILMGNLKGAKNKPTDLVQISEACNLLITKWGISEAARFFKVSAYMLRQIAKIESLDPHTKKYVQKHKLGIEKAYQLWRVDEAKRRELLPPVRNLSTADIRNLVYIILSEPAKPVSECKEIFDEKYSRKTTIMVLQLPPDLANRLLCISREKKTKPNQYVMGLIERDCNG